MGIKELARELQKAFTKPPGYRGVVRIAHTDIPGEMKVINGLTRIKGVSYMMANAILQIANIDPDKRVGMLTDDEVRKIEEILKNPAKYGIPEWLVNRPKDPRTGLDIHLTGPDLVIQIQRDIEFLKKIGCWRGWRHSLGLKVRGQRTRTTGRRGLTVGYTKRKEGRK